MIGTPGSGEKVQAEALGKNAGFKVIDVEEIILEKSKDKDYIHQEFLAECIENSVRTPTVLLVGILEERIKAAAAGGQNWVLVVGFPDSLQQLNGFQRQVLPFPPNFPDGSTLIAEQVQKNTYTVMLKSENKPYTLSDKKYAAAVRDMAELEKYLGASGDYFKAVCVKEAELDKTLINLIYRLMRAAPPSLSPVKSKKPSMASSSIANEASRCGSG